MNRMRDWVRQGFMSVMGCLIFGVGLVTTVGWAFGAGDVWYVATSGADGNDGLTWATAKQTLQAAINAAGAGDLVLASNGTYNVTTQTSLTKDVTVRGFGASPGDVVFDGGGTGAASGLNYAFSLFSVNSSAARVENLTIKGGAYYHSGYGAGMSLAAGTIDNCAFSKCYGGFGGALYMTGGLVTNSVFTSNGSYQAGGAIYVKGGTVTDCAMMSNRCDRSNQVSYGGGVYIDGGIVKNCVISDNVSHSRGGGVYIKSGQLFNCLVVRNEANGKNDAQTTHGGGMYVEGGTVRHVTVADNRIVRGIGAGVYQIGGTIKNSIMFYNGTSRLDSRNENLVGTAVSASYSCVTPLRPGTGNTAVEPMFMDRIAGDYRLHAGSPAIDSGDDSEISDDLVGQPRPQDGGSGAAKPDMGCYEMAHPLLAEVLTCDFSANQSDFFLSGDAVFRATLAGGDSVGAWYGWDFGDGNYRAGEELDVVTNSYAGPGWFTVSLTVTTANMDSAQKVKAEYIKVVPDTIYVSKEGSDTPPYASWETAARSVEGAVLSGSGLGHCTVVISNGLYVVRDRIDINVPMAVRSVNGMAVTTLDAESKPADYQGWPVVMLTHAEAVVEGLRITRGKNNYAQNGAGAYLTAGVLRDCDLDNNYAGYGGGAFMTGGVVTNCLVRNNRVYINGGGIYMTGGAVVDCVFTNNQCTRSNGDTEGGAVYMSGGMVERCHIYGNTVLSHGGGVRLAAGRLRNCLIYNNKTFGRLDNGYGGGIYQTGGLVENCTVADNLGYNQPGDGIYMTGGMVTNSIITPNGNVSLYKTGGTVGFSCYTPADESVANNIFADPEFVDPLAADYNLRPTSPCINSGINQGWMAAATDLVGNDRILGGVVDMGCLEAPDPSSGPLFCNFNADRLTAFTNAAIVFTASVSGSDTNITSYVWDFGNGVVSGPGLGVVTNRFAAGFYTVSLTITNQGLETYNETKEQYIYVAPATLYVALGGAHVAPFIDWANAATNIADAVELAYSDIDGRSTVLIGAGRYVPPAMVVVNKDITVRGVEGAAVTIISGNKVRGRRMMFVNSPQALVEDLTLADGDWYHDGLGAALRLDAGTIRHCIFSNNYGGYGGAIYMLEGLVEECDFNNNGTYINGGAIQMSGGMVRDCRFSHSYCDRVNGTTHGGTIYMAGGTVRGCEIKRSTTRSGGGGIYMAGAAARVENCTIVGCSVTGYGGTGYGGGIHITAGTVTNTIICGNEALSDGQDIYRTGGMIGFCCSPDLAHDPNGTGNINLAPQFVSAGTGMGVVHSGSDLHLLDTSPCLNIGTNLEWMDGAFDLDGNPRIARGKPDMGCYELPAPRATVVILR